MDRSAILFEAEPDLLRLTAPRAGASNSAGLASTVIRVFSRGVSSAGVSSAVLLYLGSVGLVGGVTIGFFFGSGFLLLRQPSEQIHAGSRVYDRNTEVSPLEALVECGSAQLLFERLLRQVLRATKQWSPDRTTRISTTRGDEKVAIKRYFLVSPLGMIILCS